MYTLDYNMVIANVLSSLVVFIGDFLSLSHFVLAYSLFKMMASCRLKGGETLTTT